MIRVYHGPPSDHGWIKSPPTTRRRPSSHSPTQLSARRRICYLVTSCHLFSQNFHTHHLPQPTHQYPSEPQQYGGSGRGHGRQVTPSQGSTVSPFFTRVHPHSREYGSDGIGRAIGEGRNSSQPANTRRRRSVYNTIQPLIGWLITRTLDPRSVGAPTIRITPGTVCRGTVLTFGDIPFN